MNICKIESIQFGFEQTLTNYNVIRMKEFLAGHISVINKNILINNFGYQMRVNSSLRCFLYNVSDKILSFFKKY